MSRSPTPARRPPALLTLLLLATGASPLQRQAARPDRFYGVSRAIHRLASSAVTAPASTACDASPGTIQSR